LKSFEPGVLDVLKKYKGKKPVLMKYVGKPGDLATIQDDISTNTSVILVKNYIELFDYAKLFLWCPKPVGRSIGIVGPSSGAINLLIAEMRLHGIGLAKLAQTTVDKILSDIGGSTCKFGNPVDYWPPKEFIGTEVCKVYHNAGKALLSDSNVSALFLALEFFSEIEFDFSIFQRIKEQFKDKPIIVVLIQAENDGAKRVIDCATQLMIPVFVDEVERSIRGFAALVDYYEKF
jgi:acyl-CoA synthetase (NDP forming)